MHKLIHENNFDNKQTKIYSGGSHRFKIEIENFRCGLNKKIKLFTWGDNGWLLIEEIVTILEKADKTIEELKQLAIRFTNEED